MRLIAKIENTSEIRRGTDGRIARKGRGVNHKHWLEYLSTAFSQAFAQMFDGLKINGVGAWSPKPKKLVCYRQMVEVFRKERGK